jgi:hypothetical protein
MYMLASQLRNLPVISLQTGDTVTTITQPIIEMSNLEIIALGCAAVKECADPVLMVRDIRQVASDCIIIDSEEDIGSGSDVVRLKVPLAAAYSPIGAKVITDMQRPIGKTEDYTINTESLRIQKLYIRRPVWRSWLGSSLIIAREQIIDVTPKQITVREATIDAKITMPKTVPDSHT